MDFYYSGGGSTFFPTILEIFMPLIHLALTFALISSSAMANTEQDALNRNFEPLNSEETKSAEECKKYIQDSEELHNSPYVNFVRKTSKKISVNEDGDARVGVTFGLLMALYPATVANTFLNAPKQFKAINFDTYGIQTVSVLRQTLDQNQLGAAIYDYELMNFFERGLGTIACKYDDSNTPKGFKHKKKFQRELAEKLLQNLGN